MSFPVGKLTCYYNNKITRPPWRYLSDNQAKTLESGLADKSWSKKKKEKYFFIPVHWE